MVGGGIGKGVRFNPSMMSCKIFERLQVSDSQEFLAGRSQFRVEHERSLSGEQQVALLTEAILLHKQAGDLWAASQAPNSS